MLTALADEIFGEGHDDNVIVTLPKSYARVILQIDAYDIFFVDRKPTDSEMSELEAGITAITNGLNG